MNKIASDYIGGLQSLGPVAWAQGAHGWIGLDDRPVTLAPWQAAVLSAWFERRQDVSTLGVSCIKKSGKTFTTAVLTAWRWLALPGVHFCAANDQEQAQSRVFSEIAEMCRRNPFLSQNVKQARSELEFTLTGSRLIALASDASGNAGANFLTASVTEAWAIQYESSVRNWEELTPPPGRTYGLPAMRIADSYAGYLSESKTWHTLVDRGLSGERVSEEWPIYRKGGLLLFHDEGEQAQVRCFRGSEAERIDYYDEQRESLRPNAYIRMHLNQRTSGEASFVTEEDWQACLSADVHPLRPGEQVQLYLGADASQRHDYTALVGVTKDENYTDVRFVKVWKPARIFGQPIDLEKTIGAEVLRLQAAGQVASVTFDPWQLAVVAQQWRNAGVRVIEMPQTAQRIEADSALADVITSGHLRHFKNADLDEAVRNAFAKEEQRGLRIVKEKASKKIDALIALSMANHSAVTQIAGEAWISDNPFDDALPVELQQPNDEGAMTDRGTLDYFLQTPWGQAIVERYKGQMEADARAGRVTQVFWDAVHREMKRHA